MKRSHVLFLAVLFVTSVALAFAGGASEGQKATTKESLKVVLYLNGHLGDKSYMDSANRGIQWAIRDFGITGKVIEGGRDRAKHGPDVEQLSQGDWDVVIIVTPAMRGIAEEVAQRHPEQKYILLDTTIDYSKADFKNVYSLLYKQNEASFVAGVLAAKLTTSNLPLSNKEKIVGCVGGADIPVINDFIVALRQGAEYADPQVKVLVAYAGIWNDPSKGKELALSQIQQGADVLVNLASETGLGLLDAARESKHYAIGCDSDQYMLFRDTNPDMAANIVSSILKNVDNTIYRAIKLHLEGKLEYGKAERVGIKEGGVGLAYNENFDRIVPEDIKKLVKEIESDIIAGKINPKTVFVD